MKVFKTEDTVRIYDKVGFDAKNFKLFMLEIANQEISVLHFYPGNFFGSF